MEHLSDEQFCRLAKVMLAQEELEAEDRALLSHIEQCDACRQLLLRVMQVTQALEFAPMFNPIARKRPEGGVGDTAIFQVVVLPAFALFSKARGAAVYDGPPPGTGGAKVDVTRLQDWTDSRCQVTQDSATGELVVRLEAADGNIPTVWLDGNGIREEIPLQTEGNQLVGRIRELRPGEYRIVIEK